MIIVRVELHSAITGVITELARMRIYNDGLENSKNFGGYVFQTFIGRSKEQLDKATELRHTQVLHWPKTRLHIWNLVCKGLRQMGYVEGF